jgi:hypothetical protein
MRTQRTAPDPIVAEELGQDLVLDIGGRDTLGAGALLDDLEDNLLHLLVRRLELADKDDHDLWARSIK